MGAANGKLSESDAAAAALRKELESEPAPLYVLYLEDEVDLHESFAAVLSRFGLKTLTAKTIAEALPIVAAHARDLVFIISDFRLGLPGEDGFEFRKQSIERNVTAPFAILSAFVDREMALHGLELKISAFLDKPLEFGKLAELLMREGLPRIRSLREDRELLQGFIAEGADLLDQAEQLCLELDRSPGDREPLNQLFGVVHTIKGASSFFAPPNLHRFAHRFEDLLKLAQQGKIDPETDFSAMLFRALDVLRTMFRGYQSGEHPEIPEAEIIAALALDRRGPAASSVEPARGADPATVESKHPASAKPSEIKVEVALLDEFMQMSGEMTVIRNMLNKCVRAVERQYAGDRDVAMLVDLLEELHRVNGSVQSKVSELRKVAIRQVLKPLPRAVRDVARGLGKEVALKVSGEDLRIDTALADVLSNSLLHLVKNSLDHGIELPDEREKAGKPRGATVTIASVIRDEKVVVQVMDDGKGIDVRAIRAKALSSGLRTDEQLDAMPRPELLALIFESGFSTAKKVTDISGRGVGMSVVRDAVTAVGGNIQIDSIDGGGTTFTLNLPLPKSVLIKNCLFVGVGRERFGIPEEDIVRVIQVPAERRSIEITDIAGARMTRIDGSLIPIAALRDILQIPADAEADEAARGPVNLVILEPLPGRRLALEVSAIQEVEDTVIKSLPGGFTPVDLYRGATFLSDGSVGLVLNSEGLLSRAGIRERAAPDAASSTHADRAPSVSTEVPSESTVVVALDHPGLYGLPQTGVYRIEDLSLEQAITMGQGDAHDPRRFITYRGKALPLIDLQSALGLGTPAPDRANKTSSAVVVVEIGERLYGLIVAAIVDITSCAVDPASEPAGLLRGYSEMDGRTISLIDLDRLVG